MADVAPIIVKKKKGGEEGHHGGAWKIAYADFVTAMMAFFLLMWLLNATSEEQKLGIANYFNPSGSVSRSGGSTGVLDGTSPMQLQGAVDPMATPSDIESDEDAEAEAAAAAAESQQFEEIEAQIQEQLAGLPELKALANNLVIDQTPEGLRIQITDRDEQTSMFASGSATPLPHARELMNLVATAIGRVPNPVAIKGHTDAAPFVNKQSYDNWDLSTARANTARRMLQDSGIQTERFASVVGQADRDPLIAADPIDPRNRRISIVLLRQATSQPAGPAQP